MPPYTPVVSKAQERLLFAKANRGEISMDDARGKARAAKGKKLPERVGKRANKKAGARAGMKRGSRC